MLISFSPTSPTCYATGDHLRGLSDLVSFEVDNYTPETHTYSMVDKKSKWTLSVVSKPIPPETPWEKKQRVKQALLTTNNLEVFDLEWVVFDGVNEIDEIITAKAFGGDNGAQMTLVTKALLALVNKDTAKIAILLSDPRLALTNQIRVKLGLSSLL
jgi:hypothetical protein